MSHRLQVLLPGKDYNTFKSLAKKEGLSLGEWVRQILRSASSQKSTMDPSRAIKAIQKALTINGPTADIDQMLDEIEKGYLT